MQTQSMDWEKTKSHRSQVGDLSQQEETCRKMNDAIEEAPDLGAATRKTRLLLPPSSSHSLRYPQLAPSDIPGYLGMASTTGCLDQHVSEYATGCILQEGTYLPLLLASSPIAL